jgi:acetolactate synthase I/II/III large subunit
MLTLANPDGSTRPRPRPRVDHALLELLVTLGVEVGFGVTGGPVAAFVHAAEDHERLRWVTARTEGGAVMEAIGAATMTGRPVLVVTTCGPGILGTRQALEIARSEDVRLVIVSPRVPACERGRGVPQEAPLTADYLLSGHVFDLVAIIESPDELAPLATRLAAGLSGGVGFIAHVVVGSDLFAEPAPALTLPRFRRAEVVAGPATVDEVVELLARYRFFVLAGRGAHADAELVRALADATGCPVVTTPGAKGVVDERGPASIGVCGIGGRGDPMAYLRGYRPDLALVLGSRLGGASVSRALLALPALGLVQVDRNLTAARPAGEVDTLFVQSDLRPFLEAVLARRDGLVWRPSEVPARDGAEVAEPAGSAPVGLVLPWVLMEAVQRVVVDGTDAPVLVDVGTAWPWATSRLAFSQPRRFHLETRVGSMGLAVSAAVGGAVARRGKVVALSGDWSFDMALPELRTAVDHDAPVVWVVLQNGGGQMVVDGDREVHGRTWSSARFRTGDLAGAARALGAGACSVTAEADLVPALAGAMRATGPYLVEVWVDTTRMPPYSDRFDSLRGK